MIRKMCNEFYRMIIFTTELNQQLRIILNILTNGIYKYKYYLYNEASEHLVDNVQDIICSLTSYANKFKPTLVKSDYVIENEWSLFKNILI